MKIVEQPANSNCCGAATVAMLAGVSLEEGIKAVGTRGATNYKHLIKGLKYFNIVPKMKKLKRIKPIRYGSNFLDFPSPSVLVIHWGTNKKRRSHWVVFCDGKIYDPGTGMGSYYWDILNLDKWPKIARITSYAEI